MFTISGSSVSYPTPGAAMPGTVSVVGTQGGPQSIVFSFTPVPEPSFVLMSCGLAAASFGWWRRRGGRAAPTA
jgi:hypothetical protein